MIDGPRPANDLIAATAAALDPYVSKAVRALEAEPRRRWTVKALARVAGLSRAPFARRFRAATGTTPRRYLMRHRLHVLAKAYLVETDRSMSEIAVLVGYATEFAFAKAFKRYVGVAPGRFRRRLAGVGGPALHLRAAA